MNLDLRLDGDSRMALPLGDLRVAAGGVSAMTSTHPGPRAEVRCGVTASTSTPAGPAKASTLARRGSGSGAAATPSPPPYVAAFWNRSSQEK